MARNIEIKAFVRNRADIYRKIKEASTDGPELLIQKDTFYKIPLGRLKLRQINNSQSEIIFYIRPNTLGPKTSKYYRFRIDNPNLTGKVLRVMFGIKGIVEKRREVFYVERTRIHIDSVSLLGEFIELEVVMRPDEATLYGIDIADNLLKYLKIGKDSLIDKSYLEMLYT